jgi:anti-sigma28 factor (negative regulator of flagellin synthesis)
MALARLAIFEDVNQENVARIKQGIETGNLPA